MYSLNTKSIKKRRRSELNIQLKKLNREQEKKPKKKKKKAEVRNETQLKSRNS